MALQNSKLVMIWRAVSELPKTSAKIAQATGWPKIGENSYAAMFDAGNLMVGYWVQQGLFDTLTKPSTTSLALKPRGASACGQASFSRMMLVSNPASEFVIRSAFPVNFITTAAGVGGPAEATAARVEDLKAMGSIVDDDGNYMAVEPVEAGAKLAAEAAPAAAPFVSYNRMVSNLDKSREFYGKVLGLTGVKSKAGQANFHVGHVTISLRKESAVGLVRSLHGSGRLNGDWALFAVDDIEKSAKELEKGGVRFPMGIEDSGHGRGAYFTDPDGHVLNLWQPPAKPDDIDYFPVLKRLLGK